MDSDFKSLKCKPLDEQLDGMLDFLREHPRLAIGERGYGNQYNARLWNTCAERLNAIPDGVQRDGKAWSKFWRSWKYRVRLKENEISEMMTQYQKEMPEGLVPLTSREQSLLTLIGKCEQNTLNKEDCFSEEETLNNEDEADEESDDVDLATLQNNSSAVERDPTGLEHYTRNKVTHEQMDALLDFLKKHPRLAKGLVRSDGKRHYPKQLWTKCAKRLNAFEVGAKKNADGWSKVWRHLKYQVRQKALRCQAAKEDSSLPRESFTAREKLALSLIAEGSGKLSKNRSRLHSRNAVESQELEYSIDCRRNVTSEQMSWLLKFIYEHPELARRTRGSGKKYSPKQLWAKCAKRLNAVEDGAKKSAGRWAKMWRDLKYMARKKALRYKKAMENGGFGAVPLSKREEFILHLIGESGLSSRIEFKNESVSEDSDGLADDLFDNTFGGCEDNQLHVPEVQYSDSDQEIDVSSQFIKLQKQTSENTRSINDKLQNIRANMARLTNALYDLNVYFRCNTRL